MHGSVAPSVQLGNSILENRSGQAQKKNKVEYDFTFSAKGCWSWLTSRGVMRGMLSKPSSADGCFSSLSDRLLASFTIAACLSENDRTDLGIRDRFSQTECFCNQM